MVMLCDKTDKADLPKFLAVIGNNWVAEEKFDGDRIRLVLKDGNVSLHNRRYRDHTATFPEMHSFSSDKELLLDGEMCVEIDGVSAFNEGIAFRTHCKNPNVIAAAMQSHPVTFVVFDILEYDGKDIRDKPLRERRSILDSLNLSHPNIKVCKQYSKDQIMAQWNRMQSEGREGLILKDLNSKYKEGYRSASWRKVKNILEADLKFTKYEVNNAGITVENKDGIRCLVSGRHAPPVKAMIDKVGTATLTINHLGQTKTGKFRQPTYNKIVRL